MAGKCLHPEGELGMSRFNKCQFCGTNPGFLKPFGKNRDWACMSCLFQYGLWDHDLLGDEELVDESAYADKNAYYDENAYYEELYRHYIREATLKPRRSKVKIEEIPYNGNLAEATSYYTFNPEAIEGKKPGKCKMTVEISYY